MAKQTVFPGHQYGKLTVLEELPERAPNGLRIFRCRCECGKIKDIRSGNLTAGMARSCGICVRSQDPGYPYRTGKVTKQGKPSKATPQERATYNTYRAMKQRCSQPSAINYPFYGGKGIQVCDRWLESYRNFVDDMGLRPEGLTLDRIDSAKDYSPENCRWADSHTQRVNRA